MDEGKDVQETQYQGRYEVAIDSLLDFRVYTDIGPEPMVDRIQRLSESKEAMTFQFEGRRFTWHPGSGDILPTVTVPIENSEDYEAERLAMARFLSALSYNYGYGIIVYSTAASGHKQELDSPLLQQPRLKGTIFPAPHAIELADGSEELSLCLGLVREGMASTSGALTFLSYWKAIEVAVGEQGFVQWVGSSAEELWPHEGRDAGKWFDYLKETRVAAAHAIPRDTGRLRYHPDDPGLAARLKDDNRRMLELAKRAIDGRWSRPVRLKGKTPSSRWGWD